MYYFKEWALIFIISSYLTSCMVGPDFRSPPSPHTKQYIQGNSVTRTVHSKAAGASGKTQIFHLGQNIPPAWWRIFHSSDIDTLIKTALKKNPNLAAAKAALNQAQENYWAQFGTLLPSFYGNFSAERQRFNPNTFGASDLNPVIQPSTFNLFNAYINASYTLDVFGSLRRQLEAAGAQVEYQKYELEAIFLTLSANIVTTAITIASLRSQLAATFELIASQEKTLVLVQNQFKLGSASRADVLTQENQLAVIRATLPALKQSLAVNMHTLSMLIGELPNEKKFSHFNLNNLHLPADIPLSCPSSLVKQRPDIQAAEAQLHAASAQVGVATANLYPQITINGIYGQQSGMLSKLFQPENTVWSITGAAAQPLFKGGSLRAQQKAAIAAFERSAAQYKQTILSAFRNVADALRALEHDAELLKAQKTAEITAVQSMELTRQQFRLGSVSYLNLLNAQRQYQQARISRIQAESARYVDTAALFQALGGGWWNRCGLHCDPRLDANLQQYKRYYKTL